MSAFEFVRKLNRNLTRRIEKYFGKRALFTTGNFIIFKYGRRNVRPSNSFKLEMRKSFFIVCMVSITNAFLHPLLNLGPDVIPDRIARRMGFPSASFWTQKPNSLGKSGQDIKLDELWNLANDAICSYPCQRISHFIKLEDVLRKKGLDYELRFVFKCILWMCLPIGRPISGWLSNFEYLQVHF